MIQDPIQSIQQFVTALRSKADLCDFVVKCIPRGHDAVSYASSMVEDQMIVACADNDIQSEVVAKDSQLKTFQDKFKLIRAVEGGKCTKLQLNSESTVSVQMSVQKPKQR